MKFQAVKGTRDFYPDDMAVRNAIFDAWRRVSLRNGFVEYDGPIFEYLELLTAKSGEEIVSQLFTLTDRGGRDLAIRPEMTPTLARMVGARAQALPKPIKWFSIPRLCRGERPQRGRLREFFQWNIDVVGEGGPLADAETIFVAVDLLRELGLRPEDVVVKINSRPLVAALLTDAGIATADQDRAYALLDRTDKLPAEVIAEQWNEHFAAQLPFGRVAEMLAADSLDALETEARGGSSGKAAGQLEEAVTTLRRVFDLLRNLGVTEYCDFDMHIVRGLAYYTGVVFEITARSGQARALCGGGRYDNLLAALGGPSLPAVGFGMGDVPLGLLLEEKGRRPESTNRPEAYLIDADPDAFGTVLDLAAKLRAEGIACVFSYRRQGVGKQLRDAGGRNAAAAVIVGQETRDRGVVTIKHFATGAQHELALAALLDDPRAVLRPDRHEP